MTEPRKPSAARKTRARLTEHAVAEALRPIFPGATRIPASLPGADVIGTPGLTIEVKARRDLNLTAWLKQSSDRATPDALPVVVSRPDGYGPERINVWPVTVPMWVFLELLERGGFGVYDTRTPSMKVMDARRVVDAQGTVLGVIKPAG